ncbi:2140_t:CDS:2 [Cetraspora pellucida]|uniref:2140_t:CDS:1 n=1 Tax=Cetraspora pellucida TaxID=1433469 RepID=A0A9N8ZX97_9GLOM|nr:2140_t:CDS:2 [Cetraspora pellucida]
MASPTAWNIDNIHSFLTVNSSGLRVNYTGPGENDCDVAAIRTNKPIPRQCELFYFEIDIIDQGKYAVIGIGFCTKELDKNDNQLPGNYKLSSNIN